MLEDEIKVLIAEDSPTQAKKLSYTLDRRGFSVILTGSGEEALERLAREKPDLIITDIMMPGMNGFELCRRIKSDNELKAIPVILLTSLTDSTDVIKGLESNADNFISKPFEEDYLLSRIETILENFSLRGKQAGGDDVDVVFSGEKYKITAERQQMVDFLLATYEMAVLKNEQLEKEIETRKQIEKELQIANMELKGFAHTVSHDLKGPLTALKLAEATLEDLISEEDLSEVADDIYDACEIISDNTDHAARMITDILSLAEAGQKPTEIEPVPVNDVIEKIVSERQKPLAAKGINVIAEDDLGTIEANFTQIYQIFTNLIGNAIRHIDNPEPFIEITHEIDNDTGAHCYLVRDNGPGISPENLEKIFIPFFKGKTGETGLGLSTVEKIVKVYSGEIHAYNDGGACFEFTLNDYIPEPENEEE